MTLNELITTIKGNLGDRQSGYIGGRSIDSVCIAVVNNALFVVLSRYNPEYYNRVVNLSIVSGTKEYALPTLDTSGGTVRVKKVHSYRFYDDSGVPYSMNLTNYNNFIDATRDYHEDTEGTPTLFSVWQQKIYFNCVPSQDYTLEMFVESFPKVLTVSDADIALPIEVEWQELLESYATMKAFLKLQQSKAAAFWKMQYDDLCGTVPAVSREKQAVDINGRGACIHRGTDPVLDPFVGSYN